MNKLHKSQVVIYIFVRSLNKIKRKRANMMFALSCMIIRNIQLSCFQPYQLDLFTLFLHRIFLCISLGIYL